MNGKISLILLLLLGMGFGGRAQQTVGLFHADTAAFQGYTLWSPDGHWIYLIDNCGRKVHSWSGLSDPGAPPYLLKDGSIIRGLEYTNPVFGGMGGVGGAIEHMDWDGNLLWLFRYSDPSHAQHHEIEPLANGNVLILAWEYKTRAEAIAMGRAPATLGNQLWCEHVIEVQPTGWNTGTVVWEWHLWDHLIQDFDSTQANFGVVSDHPERLDINAGATTDNSFAYIDWIHANNLTYHPELDQILINSQRLSEFYIIDHSTTTQEAASTTGGNSGKGGDLLYRWGNPQMYKRGDSTDQQLFHQHNAHWIPPGRPHAGKIMVFNNGLDRPAGPWSSVDILSPPVDSLGGYSRLSGQPFGPDTLDWQYTATPKTDFYSSHVSSAQMQPNGNVLICEGNWGHFFEVTPQRKVVWDYMNPGYHDGIHDQGDFPYGNGVFKVHRYPLDYPGFYGRDLTPGDPLEGNPLPLINGCDGTVGLDSYSFPAQVSVFPNPASEQLVVTWSGKPVPPITIHSMDGQIRWSHQPGMPDVDQVIIDISTWPKGLYLLESGSGTVMKWLKL